MKKKSKILAILIIFSILIFIIYGQLKSYRNEKELLKDGKVTIGKLDSIEEHPKRTYLHISYYIGKKKIFLLKVVYTKKYLQKTSVNFIK